MKVFITWSGDFSHSVALACRSIFPMMVGETKPTNNMAGSGFFTLGYFVLSTNADFRPPKEYLE